MSAFGGIFSIVEGSVFMLVPCPDWGVGGAMRRRDLLFAIGGVAAGWPLGAKAQQAAKLPTIGFLGPLSQSTMASWTTAFVQRLRDLGWVDGRTITIEYRWADGKSERLADIAAEFVRQKVTVIVTGGTAAVAAAKQATSVIPIVFGTAGDPVRLGLVTSLSRPGGNITGMSNQSADLPGKRDLNYCAALPPAYVVWPFWLTSGPASACWRWARSVTQVASLGLKLCRSKFSALRISRLPWRQSKAMSTHCM
jgi:hypothetical protein